MAKLTQRDNAQRLALKGNVDGAVKALSVLEQSGDVGASASLAEIAAFKGKWKEVLQRVAVVLGTPSALDTLNVYQDMVLLAARAGAELRAWAEVRELTKLALKKLGKEDADEALVGSVRDLARFAARNGKGTYGPKGDPEARRKKEFEEALKEYRAKKFKRPEDRVTHFFGLAMVYEYYPGAVALYDQERDRPYIFDGVAVAASALARDGRADEAWRAIRSKVNLWEPVEVTQIAPVVLVTDEALQELMTPARGMEILRTPRGSEG